MSSRGNGAPSVHPSVAYAGAVLCGLLTVGGLWGLARGETDAGAMTLLIGGPLTAFFWHAGRKLRERARVAQAQSLEEAGSRPASEAPPLVRMPTGRVVELTVLGLAANTGLALTAAALEGIVSASAGYFGALVAAVSVAGLVRLHRRLKARADSVSGS